MKVKTFATPLLIASLFIHSGNLFSKTFTVSKNDEADFETIQEAIDTADNGDQILVFPGEYGPVSLVGKVVHLISRDGPEITVISGNDVQPVIHLDSDINEHSMIVNGFTLTKGAYLFDLRHGGGIAGKVRSIVIEYNSITKNCGGLASAIDLVTANCEVLNNHIADNRECESGTAGGASSGAIKLSPGPNILVANNLIEKNITGNGKGGGINLRGQGIIHSNIIRFNQIGIPGLFFGDGGGINLESNSAIVEQNLIYGNSATEHGGGISISPSRNQTPEIYYNTIVDNSAKNGTQVSIFGSYDETVLVNNIISDTNSNDAPIYCDHFRNVEFVELKAEVNLIHSDSENLTIGDCELPTGANITGDPRFVDPLNHDYSLLKSSVARDRGHLEREHVIDLNGSPRQCGQRQDIGALEYCEPDELLVPFKRGDSDGNGALEVTDPIVSLTFQFLGSFNPPCMKALDFDDSGEINISDPIASLTHKFLGGPSAAAPGSINCGIDLTRDDLTCLSYSKCE